MLILVINCGSSSAKYQLFDVKNLRCIARGMVERIGSPLANLRYQNNGKQLHKKVACPDHYVAIRIIVDSLTSPGHGVIKSKDLINGIGHRVVHGGEEFKRSTMITPGVIRSIEKYSELAPLHNPPALLGIKACLKILSGVRQVAVFDTSFHQTMPPEAFLYGLPFKFYKKYGIRKYGFHGTSHRFVADEAAKILKRPLKGLKLVTCHLGNGCSMAAVKNGESIDTTMGFTPLEGLVMGTRSGDLDPAVVFYLMEKEKLSPHRISDILNKESGLLGISGVSNDMRDIMKAARGENKSKGLPRARMALEMFIYRIEKYIGAYQAAMNGLDAVILTAGIGENNPWIMKRLKKDLRRVVSKNTKFLIIPTNEELLIARDTYNIIKRPMSETSALSL
ncbi:MAG: acetate kinase [Candidatus Omnitrophica bacterium]|nr:acetate kinase [Candidatus Omnitrophota bacterium]